MLLTLLEQIEVDAEGHSEVVELLAEAHEKPEQTEEVLMRIKLWIQDRYDYSTDCGEAPFCGAASIMHEIDHYLHQQVRPS